MVMRKVKARRKGVGGGGRGPVGVLVEKEVALERWSMAQRSREWRQKGREMATKIKQDSKE